jgi:hypothetical protein
MNQNLVGYATSENENINFNNWVENKIYSKKDKCEDEVANDWSFISEGINEMQDKKDKAVFTFAENRAVDDDGDLYFPDISAEEKRFSFDCRFSQPKNFMKPAHKFKVYFFDSDDKIVEIRRFTLIDPTFESFTKQIAELFKKKHEITYNYLDEKNEQITFSTQLEFEEALNCHIGFTKFEPLMIKIKEKQITDFVNNEY